jgi:hypothetical protein
MSIRTTVTLDDDVIERVKHESKVRGATFKTTLNNLLREALVNAGARPKRTLKIVPASLGGPRVPGLNYDSVEELLEYAEGPLHR